MFMNYNEFLSNLKERKIYKPLFLLKEAAKVSDDNDIKIILLSNIGEESKTVDAFKEECDKNGLAFGVIDIENAYIEKIDDNNNYYIYDTEQKIKINHTNTAFLTRRGVVKNTFTRSIVEDLEEADFFVINNIKSVVNCENKYTTSRMLQDAGVPVPKMILLNNVENLDYAVKKIGGKFPVILKTLSGTQGIGVSIVDSIGSLKSVIQTIWKANPSIELLLQEKIESDYDLRIHVLTKKFYSPYPVPDDSIIIGHMRRNKIDKDFRTNYSLGGTVEKSTLTEEQEKIAKEAAKVLGCTWCGVDLIIDKKSGQNYVLEVNSSPGTEGIKKATGINVLKKVIEFLKDKENWTHTGKVIGYREMITIPGIGDIVAKFDTGNGALASSLTYDKLKISNDEKTVEWELGKKKFKNKIVSFSEPEVGTEKHRRPVINLDIIVNGSLYKNVDVSLSDRKDKSTKFLVNRTFMEKIGCSISPFRTFVIKPAPEDYSPKKSKDDPHAGIIFEK